MDAQAVVVVPSNSSARAIHKVAPAVLSRCFAANFVHKMAELLLFQKGIVKKG